MIKKKKLRRQLLSNRYSTLNVIGLMTWVSLWTSEAAQARVLAYRAVDLIFLVALPFVIVTLKSK